LRQSVSKAYTTVPAWEQRDKNNATKKGVGMGGRATGDKKSAERKRSNRTAVTQGNKRTWEVINHIDHALF
jgi:hypothetical protein